MNLHGFTSSELEKLSTLTNMILSHVSALAILDPDIKNKINPKPRRRSKPYDSDDGSMSGLWTDSEEDIEPPALPSRPKSSILYTKNREEFVAHAVCSGEEIGGPAPVHPLKSVMEEGKGKEKQKECQEAEGSKEGKQVMFLYADRSSRGFGGTLESLWWLILHKVGIRAPKMMS
ncbi:hypothetical protein E8E13_005802 [Curvularia kusanoi]|uniref:Uncharacterized protein n=1 Tax=Curvularia kusanoi TaxID=90978 RepID=A0A9P4TCB0_CURKU|nr:hypothetical protein E8E13_005802 [Curvularia kusanoi]